MRKIHKTLERDCGICKNGIMLSLKRYDVSKNLEIFARKFGIFILDSENLIAQFILCSIFQ